MSFKLRVAHVDEDLSHFNSSLEPWFTEINDEEEFAYLLNRIAVGVAQGEAVDYPEIEVTHGSKRFELSFGQKGQLFISELGSVNRQMLRVTPDEAIRLLRGLPLGGDHQDVETKPSTIKPASTGARLQPERNLLLRVVVGLSVFILSIGLYIGWVKLKGDPVKIQVQKFIPDLSLNQSLVREVSGVFIDEQRDGGLVLRISEEDGFVLYEIFTGKSRSGFALRPLDKLSLKSGLQGGEPALLAGEFYLIKPKNATTLFMNGIRFKRYEGELSGIGNLESSF